MPKFREITGRFVAKVQDSADADLTLDELPMFGTVWFEPLYRDGIIAFPHLSPPRFVRPSTIRAVLDNGNLYTEVLQPDDTYDLQPLHLMVTEDDQATQTWRYRARFEDVTINRDETVDLPNLVFSVPDEPGALDLTQTVGVTSGGVHTVKGPPGPGITAITSDAGVVTVVWEGGDDVQIPIPTAALATPTSDGLMAAADKSKLDTVHPVRVDTTAGTAIYLTGPDGVERRAYFHAPARSLAASIVDGTVDSPHGIKVDRENNLVTLRVLTYRPVEAGKRTLLSDLPTGYRPANTTKFWGTQGTVPVIFEIDWTVGKLSCTAPSASGVIEAIITYTVPSTLPATLPGTPA